MGTMKLLIDCLCPDKQAKHASSQVEEKVQDSVQKGTVIALAAAPCSSPARGTFKQHSKGLVGELKANSSLW
jgi:hypothetical protein